MKILWFTNIPVSVQKNQGIKIVGGSWMKSLAAEIVKKENIILGIAFQSGTKTINNSRIDNTEYFIIPRNTGNKRKFSFRYQFFMDNDKALIDYLDVVNRFQPDIIQIFGSENNFGLMIPHINIPVVIHTQGILTVVKEKFFSGITKETIKKHTSLKQKITNGGILSGYDVFRKKSEVEKRCLKECKYVLGRTDWDRRVLRVLAPNAKYFYCSEIIRSEFQNNTWEPTNNSKIRLVSLIRNGTFKGMETVIKASKILKQLEIPFEWSIIGGDEKDRINVLLSKLFGIKLSEMGVRLLGNYNAEQIVNVFKNSDVFVHPSHIENSPNSVSEAMMMGLPVIATNSGGTMSLIEDGKDGILLQDGDPYVLAGAIIELYEDKEKQIYFSKNARNRALKRHEAHKIVDNLLNIYNDIIALENKRIAK